MRVFEFFIYIYLLIIYFSCVPGFSNFVFRRSGVPAFRRSGVPAFRRSGVPAFRRSGVPAFQRSGDPAFWRSVFSTSRWPDSREVSSLPVFPHCLHPAAPNRHHL